MSTIFSPKRRSATARQARRRAGQNPYPVQAARRGTLWRDPTEAQAAVPVARPRRVRYLGVAGGGPLEPKGGIYRAGDPKQMQELNLIVVGDLAQVDALPDGEELLRGMLAADGVREDALVAKVVDRSIRLFFQTTTPAIGPELTALRIQMGSLVE